VGWCQAWDAMVRHQEPVCGDDRLPEETGPLLADTLGRPET